MNVTNVVLGVIVSIVLISCAKEKPVEVISLQKGAHPCFETKALEYGAEYDLVFIAPESASGHMVVAAQEFLAAEMKYEKSVTRTTIERAGKEDTFALYLLGDKGHHCVARDTGFACTELPAAQVRAATSTPGSQVDMEKNPAKYQAQRTREEFILGEKVVCCQGTFAPTSEHKITTEYCYTQDGIPLKITSEIGEVKSEITATILQRKVNADAFTLPQE